MELVVAGVGGGGLLGALGSHAIDAVRWLFGEIESVCGAVETLVHERKDPVSGEMRPNETDDYCSFLMKLIPHDRGRRGAARGVVSLSAMYASGGKNQVCAAGSLGTLVLDGEETLSGALGYNHSFEDLSLGTARKKFQSFRTISGRAFLSLGP